MRFTKLHGAGNDYLVIDGRGLEHDWTAVTRRITERHFGVGSDGLLVVASSQVAAIRMRVFNPDGSEAEMSGDGIRCFTKYVVDRDIAQLEGGVLKVETGNGVRPVVPIRERGSVTGARVDMGKPRLRPEEVPVLLPPGVNVEGPLVDYPLLLERQAVAVTCVSMGNPHAATFIEEPVAQFPLLTLGPQVEHHPLFPKRVNFEVVNVIGPGRLRMRTWERGVGETLACGTGACAVAVAARLKGLALGEVEIELLGGVLKVAWDGQGPVWLEGPVEEVFEGEWRE